MEQYYENLCTYMASNNVTKHDTEYSSMKFCPDEMINMTDLYSSTIMCIQTHSFSSKI